MKLWELNHLENSKTIQTENSATAVSLPCCFFVIVMDGAVAVAGFHVLDVVNVHVPFLLFSNLIFSL